MQKLCEYCHRSHDGTYASGRFCCPECSSKSRKKNRLKTIAKQKRLGVYKKNFKPNVSQLLMNVSRVLSKYGIKHQVQHQVGRYYFDIKIGNVLLEVNGSYWHCDPLVYNAGSVVNFPGHRKKLALNVWKRDLKKKLEATKKGYRVIYIWENDIHKLSELLLVSKIVTSITEGTLISRVIK